MTDPEKGTGLWTYRRLADKTLFAEGTYPGDISLVNWPQNDYMLGNLYEVPAEEAARHLERAKQLSLSLLYWLQTEAPRSDGGTGWKGMRLRPDVVGTEDGLAKHPYIRESRRIRAEFTVVEQHVSTDFRMKETGAKREDVKAAEFKDSVGIGSYRIDLHPSTGGDNSIDISSLPLPDPAGGAAAATGREPAAGVQESGGDAHHERLLPAASGGMEHRRSGGGTGGLLCDKATGAARGAETERVVEQLPEPAQRAGGAAGVAEGDAEVRKLHGLDELQELMSCAAECGE